MRLSPEFPSARRRPPRPCPGSLVAGVALALLLAQARLGAQEPPRGTSPAAPGLERAVATSSVGYPVRIDQLLLPGSKLISRPLESREAPLVIRVLDGFAHGDGYRYDLEVTGLDPGRHNLCAGLVREDGTSSADLPPVWIEITSQLPPGQVKPHELAPAPPAVSGLYTGLLIAAGGLWLLGLAGILFWGRGKEYQLSRQRREVTVADRLRPLLEQAAQGELTGTDRAALERVLLAFWRKKLRLESLSPAELYPQLLRQPEANQLLGQLERWLHAPAGDQEVDWQELLAPYRAMNLSELEL